MENKVYEQYKTDTNFNMRGSLHSFNTNKTEWNNWCFEQMKFPKGARILELGCGTGDFWEKNIEYVDSSWEITLSDFSEGMLNSSREKLGKYEKRFVYKIIDAQDIPCGDECFDVVIARHMLYLVPDMERALSEIKRVLVKEGIFYTTTNSYESMSELNELVESFDPNLGLSNNGMCDRFNLEEGENILKKHFKDVGKEILQGRILVPFAEPIVSYKASTIKGSSVLIGERRNKFAEYIEDIIKRDGTISITTKAGMFKVVK